MIKLYENNCIIKLLKHPIPPIQFTKKYGWGSRGNQFDGVCWQD